MLKSRSMFSKTLFDNKFFWLTLITVSIGLIWSIIAPSSKVSGQSQIKSCTTCSEPIARTIYAPTIELPEAESSDIVLNCRSMNAMDAVPTFYTSDGEAIIGDSIHLQPSEMRFVTVESLIPANERGHHVWGGMSISYTGRLMEVWAQITLRGRGQHASSDVTFSVLNNYGASTQEAVWWMPKPGRAVIVLGNSSNTPIHTALQFASGETQEVDIAPFATNYIRRNYSNGGNPLDSGVGESVKLVTTGPAGSLKATGYVSSMSNNFTSSIRFYETPNAVQQHLFATNLRVKDSSLHLLLKNTSTTNITAAARFTPNDGAGAPVILPTVSLESGQIKELDLGPLQAAAANRNDLSEVSVRIDNSGSPGSLIGALYSTNQTTSVVYDVPLRDSGVARNSTGAYPWRLDDDYQTIVSITNVGSDTTKFNVDIHYGTQQYRLAPRDLAAGQTAVFNLKQIRDQQIPDSYGNVIPLTVTSGQFRWSVIKTSPTPVHLIGRSEVVSQSRHVSISYSCPMCCPSNGPNIAPFNPFFSGIGETTFHTAFGEFYDCYGYGSGYSAVSLYDASSNNTSIAQLDSGLTMQGMSAGATTWTGHYYQADWYSFGEDSCLDRNLYMQVNGDMTVVSIQITKSDGTALPSPFRLGISAITTAGVTNNRTQSLKAAVTPASEAANVTISVSSGITLSNRQTNTTTGIITFDVVGNTKSVMSGDASITASHPSVQPVVKTVSVVVPAKIAAPHDTMGQYLAANRALDATTSPVAVGLPAGQVALSTIYVRILSITVKDQFDALIGDIYQGAEVTETDGTTIVPINQMLSSTSTYSDAFGEIITSAIVNRTSSAATRWRYQPLQPMVSRTSPAYNTPVQIDGFSLNPAIVNRSYTATPPNTLTVTWPN